MNAKFSFRWILLSLLFILTIKSTSAQTRFGAEIELHGKGHQIIHLCMKGGVYYLTGAIAYPSLAKLNHEDISDVHAAATLGVGFGCYAAFMLDTKISEVYLNKIATILNPRALASELKLDWIHNQGDMKRSGLKISYPSGDVIVFTSDPQTIEVNINPQTAEEIKEKLDFYQREIFDLAKSAGLLPPKQDGIWNGGHIHIDLKTAFGGDPQKFKKFILDFWSHGELARGILVQDFLNAAPIKGQGQMNKIRELVNYLDSLTQKGKTLGKNEIYTLYKNFPRIFNKHSFLGFNSSSMNLKPKFGTLEIRALRSQKDAKSLALITELLDRRIQYTNSQPDHSFSVDAIRNSWTDSEKIQSFQSYIEESGLNFDHFLEIIPKKYLLSPLTRKKIGDQLSCIQYFKEVYRPIQTKNQNLE